MPDLLIELFCEEIPARMQRKAAGDLRQAVTGALVDNGLTYEGAREYWTPRRLALDIRGLTAHSAGTAEEIKGPSVTAPEQAVQGFLRKAGLASVDEAERRTDAKKGDFYVAILRKPGRSAEEIVAEALPAIIRDFPWPKSMRWGKASAEPGALRFVRPLRRILCTFGPETEEPVVIPFEIGGIAAANVTEGHRFHAPEPVTVRRFGDYAEKLAARHVVIDAERRKEMILADARNLAFANGVELVEDDGLLEEVAGLVEWPVVLMGTFEEAFLEIPDEVIRLTIKTNQKCFVCRDPESRQLTNRFILVSNIAAGDGGAEIARGNGKVVRARLSDALHFWKTDQASLPDLGTLKDSAERFGLDLSKPLDQRMAKLDRLNVTFHAKLGTQGERVARIAALARELAPVVGAEPAKAVRAAHLAKADLTTAIVGEFPEVQGTMGRTYALMQGEDPSIAAAIEDHYKPQGPSDAVPTDPVAIAVALADKLDTLTGFWAIDEKPTGSKDPYALRRAALGVIRIVVENGLRLRLARHAVGNDLLSFFHDRLKVFLRDSGARHDLIDAVLGASPSSGPSGHLLPAGGEKDRAPAPATPSPRLRGEGEGEGQNDDLLLIVARVRALQSLLETETGANLLAGTRRALNILAAEEKKDGEGAFDRPVDRAALTEPSEKELRAVLDAVAHHVDDHVARDDYAGAFAALADLRPAVDAFFGAVMVNADDPAVRVNRLALLAGLRATTRKLADFGRIAG